MYRAQLQHLALFSATAAEVIRLSRRSDRLGAAVTLLPHLRLRNLKPEFAATGNEKGDGELLAIPLFCNLSRNPADL
jgi:hypothetical protein